ncbi:putative glycosyltransferase YkcC [Terrihabitans soli]|uniref:Putative glycosyltransferase YkcC n=1 Tax=Terrihabitans soli TaxID=708113 RepID=A0A6S6QVE7_9HYPH|nr:glycosyltransferase family 2 protein [Terrihabitans soli]BCJ91897.1 putative glycosyltransferase YkcC [Terrihabitans soli]
MASPPPASEPSARKVALSVVVPVYDCAGTLVPLHERLTQILKPLVKSYEIVFVDDRSQDASWSVMRRLAAEDATVVACRLSKNVGQHLAITAGLEQCCGARAVVIDGDLQDPPETIPALLAAAKDGEGADIVFARRVRPHYAGGPTFGARLREKLFELLSGHKIPDEPGAFSLLSRRAIDAFLKYRERDRHYLILLHELGFEAREVDYVRETRLLGRPSTPATEAFNRRLAAMAFSSPRLLYFIVYTGFFLATLGLVAAAVLAVLFFTDEAVPDFAFTVAAQFLTAGVITVSLGAIGLYIGRLFEAARERPLYFIQDRIDAAAQLRKKLDIPMPMAPPRRTAKR